MPDKTRWIGNPIGPWADEPAGTAVRMTPTPTPTSRGTATSSYDVTHYDLDLDVQRATATGSRARPPSRVRRARGDRRAPARPARARRRQGHARRQAGEVPRPPGHPHRATGEGRSRSASPSPSPCATPATPTPVSSRTLGSAGWEELERRRHRRRPAARRPDLVPLQRPALQQGDLPDQPDGARGATASSPTGG